MREIKWAINVGDSFKEKKRDITIIERKIRRVKKLITKPRKSILQMKNGINIIVINVVTKIGLSKEL